MMDQNQSNIIIQKHRKYSPHETMFLSNLPSQPGTPEPIQVKLPSTVPCEGEHNNGDNNLSMLQPRSQRNQTKREREDPQTESEDTENQSQRKL